MATENPIRIHDQTTSGKWSTRKETSILGSSSASMRGARDMIPSRSESAPPTVEGSLSAIGKLYLTNTGFVAEEQIYGESSYLPYYGSNVNLNPRLSPPLTSWRDQQGDHGFDRTNSDWRLSPFGQQSKLQTYREDSEDDRSPHGSSGQETGRNVGFWPGHNNQSLDGLAQEDYVQTLSPPLTHVSTEEGGEYEADFVTNTATSSSLGVGINSHLPKGLVSGSMSATNLAFTEDIESKMMTMNIAEELDLSRHANVSWQQSHQVNQMQQLQFQQQISDQFQNSKPQVVVPPAINLTFPGMSQFSHGLPPSFGSTELHGYVNPPYMASSSNYYPNMHPHGYFSPQYGVGGYALNTPTVFPTFMPGYPHGAIPVSFDGTTVPSFSGQNSGVTNTGSSFHGVDMQQLGNPYGQYGFSMQPMSANAFLMQYAEQSYRNPYNVPGQFSPLMSPVAGGSRIGPPDLSKGAEFPVGSHHQKIQYPGDLGVLHKRGDGYASHYVNPSNTSLLMQLPMSTSQNFPGSPAPLKNELRFTEGSFKNPGSYSRWQGQREMDFNTRVRSFLEELKSGRGRRFELSDIAGHIVQFSVDQHGSRFIQQKLENCSDEDKVSVFKEVLPHASRLIVDVFGNYVIQKFFEYGTNEQRKELADQLASQILSLSLQMYGCRVIQKALDVIELDQKAKLVSELDGHVLMCVHDQNGNHVIQKCIECISTDKIGFILSAFRDQVATLSMHPYGCRVIQRVLEHCMDQPESQFIVDEILESVCTLAQNQYGNYVTQHVLQRGNPQERGRIISKLLGNVVQMSQHKFASNVVEKCMEFGDFADREMLIQEIIGNNDGNDNLLVMMKDQYANYVIQKLLDTCTDGQRDMLFSRIKNHVTALKKYTYGKHIVARFEQLYGEEISQISEENRNLDITS